VGDARASSDIDPCGSEPVSTTAVSESLGFDTRAGPAALQCRRPADHFPPFLPEDVPVAAPDAPNVNPAFDTGFPFMIGPDGSEVNYDQITALISEEEAMQGADWDWTVPSNTGTGDWYSWFTWTGTGGFVGDTPAITPSSIDPAIANWYSYNIDDSYYQSRPPVPYVRVYLGATQVAMEQGPGITATAESLASQNSCTPIPDCFGRASARSARPRPAPSGAARGTVGLAIHPDSSAKDPVGGTSGNDEFRAERGDIKILAGAGHDQVLAGRGANRLRGGGGHDELTSFAGADLLKGNSGHDVLQGGPGPVVSIGNRGSDSLFDAKGSDRMLAGGGDDRIVVRDRRGDDVIDCGPGTDIVIADPGDRIVRAAGPASSAPTHARVRVGAFTRNRTPKGSTGERVYSSVLMPPRKPPSIGHHAGRPPGAPEPAWPVLD
jgi:RTX calcium-binding nonapeptide repeat (4 copies)